MTRRRPCRLSGRKGFALVLAMVFLALFAAMAIGYTAATNVNMQQATNCADVTTARFQAESGLSYLVDQVCRTAPPTQGGQPFLDAVAAQLASALDGTGNLRGQTVQYDGNSILIPEILTSSAGQGFAARLSLEGNAIRLRVTGRDGAVTRTAAMNLELVAGGTGVFDYGVASRGKISMTGNASVRGANEASEACMYSGTFTDNEAFKLTGNCTVQGDVFTANPASYVTLTGNVSIGGETTWGDIEEHIHIGVGEVPFPEVDPNVFEPFAASLVGPGTSTSGNKTFTNIRILAGTNPNFSGNITLKGVVFIEQPNQVRFTGNLNITGVIVTQDAGDDAYNDNTVKFTGNTTFRGVEYLPDLPEFHDLREMPGSAILAPGFGVEFTGNFGTIGGCIAVETLKVTGNAGGTIRGSLICYADEELSLTGNASLTIDRQGAPDIPPGFWVRSAIVPRPGSYAEE